MPGVDAEAGELGARGCNVHVALAVEPLTSVHARLEQTVFLEPARKRRRHPGALAQFGELDLLVFGPAEAGSPPPSLRWRRRELLADHPQRQELVPLEAQDRSQAVDVILSEEAVAPWVRRGASNP